jgi:malonyl CoA-acyl carrier protein transacylase
MICWMFPGQPIAFAAGLDDDAEYREIAQLCQHVSGFNPLENRTSGANLTESVRLQLYGVCCSLYRLRQCIRQGITPDLIAEHSMGIFPALVACGSIDEATALALTWRTGMTLALMARQGEYALGCVIGMTCGTLEGIAANNGVYIANHNTSRHFLLAGEREKVAATLHEATACGAFSTSIFPCDAPLHTPLIGVIVEELQRVVSEYNFCQPRIPLMDHIGQTMLTAAAIPAFLVDELRRPVYWETTYRALRSRGVTHFQEIGVGSALSKFNRWIDSEQ